MLIAIAVACRSKLIIADEPTTALDVTTQAQVMELLLNVVKQYKTSLIVVTHNLGLVSRYAKRIYVMYAGRVVECGTTEDLLTRPKHPYTMGLLQAVPRLDDDKEQDLIPIHGAPPNLAKLPDGCYFMPRCPYACDKCKNLSYPVYIVTYTAGENEDTREWTVFAMDTDVCTYLYGFCALPDAAADMSEIYQNIFSQLSLSDEE